MQHYSAFDVSCHIVGSSIDAGEPVSNLQLQKILYFVQVGYYAKRHEFLFEDDFEAWQYGPVVPEVYRLFSIWGGDKITRKPAMSHRTLSESDKALIDPIICEKRNKAPWTLVAEAHAEGSPWRRTMSTKGDRGVISKALICASI